MKREKNGISKFGILLVLLSLFVISCNSERQEERFERALSEASDIQNKVIIHEFKDNALKSPSAMICLDSMYVIADENKSNMLHFYDKDGICVYKKLPSGHGENEIMLVSRMQNLSRTAFWVSDVLSNKVIYFEKDSIYKIKGVKKISGFQSFATCKDTVVGICAENDSRFKVLNIYTGKASYFGSYNQYGVEPQVGKEMFAGYTVANPETGEFASFSFNGISWQFGNFRTRKMHAPVVVESPEYSIGESGAVALKGKGLKVGFVSLAVSSQCVFALYCGRPILDALKNPDLIERGNYIFRFNWDGEIEDCYKTKDPVIQLATDEAGHHLVMLSENKKGYYVQSMSVR